MNDGSCITESLVTARRVAIDFTEHANLLPPGDLAAIDAFIDTWVARVEPAYYNVLSADSEGEVNARLAGFLEALGAIEDQLWQRAMQAS
mmetsp:Transcript_6880/g.15086  ORF Transcript_6880/g.15086 Transcript_6880/m.15086 type:complete len:90 (-) Transcript_6880:59-328(-)